MKKILFFSFAGFLCLSSTVIAAEKVLTIIHTNDLHSHLLGHSPNRDYTPSVTGDDDTRGGWARIATVIKNEKRDRDNPVLVLDGGDFLMGTLFHMLSREEAFELALMKEMGYDATTIGNHEFDLKPDGLARILTAAAANGKMPAVLLANALFDKTNPKDDSLEKAFNDGIVKPYIVLERDGLKIGLFGLMGKDSAEKSPFAKPVKFADIISTSQIIVKHLREQEKVDVVICLSHSGLHPDSEKSEDEVLARDVPGIDIIVSGHTHTKLEKPIVVEPTGTIVVQAGDYGKYVGVLDVIVNDGKVKLGNYKLVEINDSIRGDEAITAIIEKYISVINDKVLGEPGLTFYQSIAETDFDLTIGPGESNLGNMIADAFKSAVNRLEPDPDDRVDLAIQANGLIRSNILKGKTGQVAVCDLFRANPLGIGLDDTMGYPLLTFYLYASEIKKASEVPATVAALKKDTDYLLQLSGMKIKHNPYRMPFDRVTEILIEGKNGEFIPLDYSASNKKLYKVCCNFYIAAFIKIIGSFTNGILDIVPKDKNGNPIDDLGDARIDEDKTTPGIQELKDWKVVMEYVRSFEDTDGDGIPDIPQKYKNTEGRIVVESSLNPYNLLKRGNYITWIAFAAFIIGLGIVALIAYVVVRYVKKSYFLLEKRK